MSLYEVKNWRNFQHYKDRNPPWIKLHYSLLSSEDWVLLDNASRALAIAIMLVASRNDGKIDLSPKGLAYIKRVAYFTDLPSHKPLIDCGFLVFASGCKQEQANDTTETETETETETDLLSSLQANIDGEGSKKERKIERLNGKRQMIEEIIGYLNNQARRRYRVKNPNDTYTAHADIIYQRLKEGYTVEQCKDVIGTKSNQWMGDEKMDKYLNPETLFRKTNFAKYLAEAEVEL